MGTDDAEEETRHQRPQLPPAGIKPRTQCEIMVEIKGDKNFSLGISLCFNPVDIQSAFDAPQPLICCFYGPDSGQTGLNAHISFFGNV